MGFRGSRVISAESVSFGRLHANIRREVGGLREREKCEFPTMREKRPPEIGPGGRAWCEFRCEFLATTQRFQIPRYDSDCPEHRVSTTFCRTSVDLVAASGPGGRWFKSTRPD